ncbi:portal protein [Acinetobacter phage SH-Ab 15497]|uniref:Portal protein n=1 Tax=Acinetobacter phage SH-Ab 15497 TaxID=2060946 RepID=A0ACD6B910_BPSHA|nr:portal protein [Acinetobacter phage SH-Ab 15497]
MRDSNNIKYVREDAKKMHKLWAHIRMAMEGSRAIKDNAKEFVPHPDNTKATTPEGVARYKAYIERAVWYGASANTVDGMLGQIFARDPVFTGPEDKFDMLINDVDGSGLSIHQQARDSAEDALSLGRGGLFVDYSYVTTNGVSEAQEESGEARPYIKFIAAEDILNWRERWVNGAKRTTLLVFREESDADDDGYQIYKEEVWRELRLVDGTYWQRTWRENDGQLYVDDWISPTKADGSQFDEIPFVIFGSKNNDPTIDMPPMRDLVELNIAHFRNSADYEEACFICGQPTLFLSGLTEHWVKNVLGGAVVIGSRDAVPLPVNAKPELLQAEGNGMVKEAMDQKERQMVALGAKLIDSDKTQRTFGEASMEAAAQNSVLSRVSKNVSDAYTKALRWAAMFLGLDEKIEYELNSDFDINKMSPEELAAVISAWQSNAISFTEMRWQIKKGGRAYLEDEDMRNESEQDDPLKLDITKPDPNEDPNASEDDQTDPNDETKEKDAETGGAE